MELPQIKWDQRHFILLKPLNSLVWKKKICAVTFPVRKKEGIYYLGDIQESKHERSQERGVH